MCHRRPCRRVGGFRAPAGSRARPACRHAASPAQRLGYRDVRLQLGYESAPGPDGSVVKVARTKALGGTSWLTRFALRGSPADFDAWPAGWHWDDVLPYFVELEADADYGDDPWHGSDGPMPVRRYLDRQYSDAAAAGFAALEAAGFPSIEDHNRPGALGVGRMPMNSIDGLRVTTVDAYLPLGRTRANLTIKAETQVARIVFNGTRASGVELVDGSVVEAGHVVLSAGVYGSPALLMRSGVGPAAHLRSLQIPIVADLSGVGANLLDHPSVGIDPGFRGPAADGAMHFVATFHASSTPAAAPPDLMYWWADPLEDDFELSVVLLKPRSTGTVRLRSVDPLDPPVIELPGLTEREDLDRLVEGTCAGWR